MRILYSATLLAASDPTYGRVGPSGLSFNGAPLLDVAQFFRADYATVYGRGDGPLQLGFTIVAHFTTPAQVLAFCGTHREVLPVQSDLTLIDDEQSYALTMVDCVRQVTISQVLGLSVVVQYQFTGSRFESDDVPDAPSSTDTVKAINQALTAATVEQAIAYDTPFASSPRGVSLQLSAPDGGAMFGWQIRESSRTAAGFTVDFDAAVPASGYKLTGIAVL